MSLIVSDNNNFLNRHSCKLAIGFIAIGCALALIGALGLSRVSVFGSIGTIGSSVAAGVGGSLCGATVSYLLLKRKKSSLSIEEIDKLAKSSLSIEEIEEIEKLAKRSLVDSVEELAKGNLVDHYSFEKLILKTLFNSEAVYQRLSEIADGSTDQFTRHLFEKIVKPLREEKSIEESDIKNLWNLQINKFGILKVRSSGLEHKPYQFLEKLAQWMGVEVFSEIRKIHLTNNEKLTAKFTEAFLERNEKNEWPSFFSLQVSRTSVALQEFGSRTSTKELLDFDETINFSSLSKTYRLVAISNMVIDNSNHIYSGYYRKGEKWHQYQGLGTQSQPISFEKVYEDSKDKCIFLHFEAIS